MLSDEDHSYYFRRAETELRQAQQATCAQAMRVHAELAERYMSLCGGMSWRDDGEPDARPFRR